MNKRETFNFDPRSSEVQRLPGYSNNRGSCETRVSHVEILGRSGMEPLSPDETGVSSFWQCEETTQSLSSWKLDSISNERRGEALKNLIDQLSIRKEKHANVVKFYSLLESQLNENFRLSVIELYSKRNEALSYLDSFLDKALEKLKKDQSEVQSLLRKLSKDLNGRIEAMQTLIDSLGDKVSDEDFDCFKGLLNKGKDLLHEGIPKPEANFDDIQLVLAEFPRFISSFTQDSGAQTDKPKHTAKLPHNISFSRFYRDGEHGKIPFLGLHKVKIYVPKTYTRFCVASLLPSTTTGELLDALRGYLAEPLSGAYLKIICDEQDILLQGQDLPGTLLNTMNSQALYLVKN